VHEGVSGPLDQARDAARRNAWHETRELYSSLDATLLAPEDLEHWAEAAWWVGAMDEALDVRSRAYAAWIGAGEQRAAALMALRLAWDHHIKRSPLEAGWLARAERLLAAEPESVEHGFLARYHAHEAFMRGDLDETLSDAEKTLEVGTRFGNRDLMALGLHDEGRALVKLGRADEGFAMLDEATVAAVGGELSPNVTAVVYCGMISACRDVADYGRAGGWTEAAKRWCERQAVSGFPGLCRVYRAEVMRLRGALADAEQDAQLALAELENWAPAYAGQAFHELGEVRLRAGDLAGAEESFVRAHELGTDPQPGLALLRLARGDAAAAARGLDRALAEKSWDRLGRARLLPARIQAALALGDATAAAAAVEELEGVAADFGTASLKASAEMTRGAVEVEAGDAAAAAESLGRAVRLWQEADAPYEAAQAQLLLGRAYLADGDRAGAELELRSAESTFKRLGAGPDARRAFALLSELREHEPQTLERTFVFTDIVSSTALLEAVGDQAWRDLIAWHDRTFRALLAEHGGEEVDHTGDGFFVSFPDPASALACAAAIQRTLAEHRRTHGFALSVRIGAHAGEATAEAGGELRGRDIHEAARISALAGAGEILASRETAEAAGVEWAESRRVELKGIAEPVEIVTVTWR
jgi:class 3 adenylate cyclase